jgi:hypothetical protein
VYTCNFARLRSVPPGLRPVSIARGTPRWFRGLRYEALAPEWEWLRASREEYDRAFRRRLNQLDPVRVYEELGDGAVLLCWCKHNAGCHRRLVAEWLEESLGTVIPEWGYPYPRSDCRPYAATGGIGDRWPVAFKEPSFEEEEAAVGRLFFFTEYDFG